MNIVRRSAPRKRSKQWIMDITLDWLEVQDEVERVIIIRHLTAQSAHIEIVLNVVIVDLGKELVASQVAEPCNPEGVVSLGSAVVAVRIRLLCGSKRTRAGVCTRWRDRKLECVADGSRGAWWIPLVGGAGDSLAAREVEGDDLSLRRCLSRASLMRLRSIVVRRRL